MSTQWQIDVLENFPEESLEHILESLAEGKDSGKEIYGFGEPALNTIEGLALGFYRAQRYEKAAPIYGFLLQMDPERATAWRGLGAICQALKNFGAAVDCYRLAVMHNEEDHLSRLYWGESLCALGNRVGGVEIIREALSRSEKDPWFKPWRIRGEAIVAADGGIPPRVVLMDQGRSLAADARRHLAEQGFDPVSDPTEFDPGVEISADDILANSKLLKKLQEVRGLIAQGKVTYRELGGFTPEEMHGGYAVATKYLEVGQPVEALELAGWLLFLDAHDARFHLVAGIAMHQLKLWDGAEYYYNLANHFERNNPMTLIYRGECQIMMGEKEQGLAYVKEGLQVAENKIENKTLITRGEVILKQFGP